MLSGYSVWISLLYAAVNNLDILSCAIYIAYFEASYDKKLWTVAGKEFGRLDGTPMWINQELYGLKSVGNYWHKALSTTLSNMNFEPIRTDPDIWLIMSTNFMEEKH